MTKSEEIEILRTTAKKLKGGYCEQWLLDQIPFIESDLRSDFEPTRSFSEVQAAKAAIIAEAKAEAEALIANAKKEAEKIESKAMDFAAGCRNRLGSLLRTIEHELDRI